MKGFLLLTAVVGPDRAPAAEQPRELKVAIAQWPTWKIVGQGPASGIDVDLITSFGYTPQRAEFACYLKPAYTTMQLAFYSNGNKPRNIRSYAELYGKRIGVILGSV